MESDDSGIGPPLYETQTLLEAEVGQGQKVIMECGRPPLSSQVTRRRVWSKKDVVEGCDQRRCG